ncbi:hypothetical protein EAO71_33545 [Streptomyces sp. ms191]|uniref:hypothetical protein n=1 Tax=Streptomyces sp. ms191 TaxID=1827978 RepID=UPI0011CD6118|nr:hypothetical protein [Streptomyces sp. ms191]TXS19875.1 hypothetical protein EAO71_33545 [Streptomyces sp. ms191]
MTRLQEFPTAPTSRLDFDPYRFPALFIEDLPEETHSVHGFMEAAEYPLPAPAPGSRIPLPLRPADRRRLDLHAALTTAGIAPLPGDLDAIEALCALDDTTHLALQRWITRAAA